MLPARPGDETARDGGRMRWWVNRGGQPEGPLEQAQIADQLRVGQLPPTTQVAPESGGGWQPISAVPEFASALAIGQDPETAATMAVDSKSLFGPDGMPPPPTGSPIAPGLGGAAPTGPAKSTPAPLTPAPLTPAPLTPAPVAPAASTPPPAQIPAGNPMVAGTMAMDSASLMKAAAASQAGLGLAPGYAAPASPPASVPHVNPGFAAGPPAQAAAPSKTSKLPYLLLGCGALSCLVMMCLAAGIIISRS